MSVASGIQLRDIDDIEGFVIGCLNRTTITFTSDEREGLLAEGMCLLFELERKFNGKGSFSGYASQFLPRRLGDAWHQMNPHHFRAPDESGKRRWQYLEPAISYEANVLDGGFGNADGLSRGNRKLQNREDRVLPTTHWSPARISVPTVASACAGA